MRLWMDVSKGVTGSLGCWAAVLDKRPCCCDVCQASLDAAPCNAPPQGDVRPATGQLLAHALSSTAARRDMRLPGALRCPADLGDRCVA